MKRVRWNGDGVMRIELCVDQRSLRGWHIDLVERLTRLPGIAVGMRWANPPNPRLPGCVDRLFSLERALHRISADCVMPAQPTDLNHHVGEGGCSPDILLDLTGGTPAAGRRRWRLTFDGQGGEGAAVASLLRGQMPTIAISDVETGLVVASARPGSETPHIVLAAFEELLRRTETVILSALGPSPNRSIPTGNGPAFVACREVALFAAKSLARTTVHRAYRLLYRTPHWQVGWRFVDGPDTMELGRHPESGWTKLPDDGFHFYADPFPIVVDGRTWLFVEDLDHRTGKGVISAVAFDEAGPVGRPAPVLEEPHHLSYPFVFEEDGAVFMIPESSAVGRVDLYRASRFPDRWIHEATLLDGIEASDATVFRHEDRWWMTATVRDGGSYSDALHVWSSEVLRGPWYPHAANPVLVDSTSARPAGRVVAREGRLMRPVQDCSAGYGASLALAEITRLDDIAFEQTIVSRLTPGAKWPGRKLHTLNRAGRLECIDGSAWAPRFWGRREPQATPLRASGARPPEPTASLKLS